MVRRAVLSLLVFAVALLPFAQAVRFGRINCDDWAYTNMRRPTAAGLTSECVRFAFTDIENAIWMPLTYLAYALDFAIAGGNEDRAISAAHAGSVLWHGGNAVLLFWLVLLILKARGVRACAGVAAGVALFWAVHPLRCESVVWIASKKDVMSAFFLLAALLLWTRWRISRRVLPYCGSIMTLALGALCKPSVMVFVGIVALLDFFVFRIWADIRTMKWTDKNVMRSFPSVCRRLTWYLLPLLMCLAIAVEAAWAQSAGHATGAYDGVPKWWNVLNAACSCGIYVLHTFVPFNLAPQCVMRWPGLPRLMLTALGVFGCTLWLLWKHRDKDWVLLAGLWFFGCLVPFLGLSGFGYHAYADRFTYIPALGLSVAAAVGLSETGGALSRRLHALARVGGAAVVLFFAFATVRQTAYWEDDLKLWTHTLEVDGERSYLANRNLGIWHWEFDHDVEKASRHFKVVWEHDPVSLGRCVFLYMASLIESGRKAESDKLMLEINKWMGYETRKNELSLARGMILGEYVDWVVMRELSFLYNMISDEHSVQAAENQIKELIRQNGKVSEKNVSLLYLQGKIAEARGDRETARRFYRTCVEECRKYDYIKYTFLDNKLKGGW